MSTNYFYKKLLNVFSSFSPPPYKYLCSWTQKQSISSLLLFWQVLLFKVIWGHNAGRIEIWGKFWKEIFKFYFFSSILKMKFLGRGCYPFFKSGGVILFCKHFLVIIKLGYIPNFAFLGNLEVPSMFLEGGWLVGWEKPLIVIIFLSS